MGSNKFECYLVVDLIKIFWYLTQVEDHPIVGYIELMFPIKLVMVCNYTPAHRRGRGVYCFPSVRPSVRPEYFSPHFSQ
jgi:hypothetical protein